MTVVRLTVSHDDRNQIVEVERSELALGSGSEADVIIDHPSVAPLHARLVVRRHRLILVSLGKLGKVTRIGAARVWGPAALPTSAAFHLGDVALRAELVEDVRPWVGRIVGGHQLRAEIPSADFDARRFRVAGEGAGELLLIEAGTDPEGIGHWRDSILRSAHAPHLPGIIAHGAIEGRAFVIEALPPGARLAEISRRVARGQLLLPIEARLVILCQTAEALASMHGTFGPHGALDRRAIHCGIDGELLLLRPAPAQPVRDVDAERRRFLSPERRRGGAPSRPADGWALARLAKSLGDRERSWPRGVAAWIRRLSAEQPERRDLDLAPVAEDLRALATRAGLDPSVGHLARVVRLLHRPERELARVA